jgi:hypothetical protein
MLWAFTSQPFRLRRRGKDAKTEKKLDGQKIHDYLIAFDLGKIPVLHILFVLGAKLGAEGLFGVVVEAFGVALEVVLGCIVGSVAYVVLNVR